jgi:dGTPase
MARPNRDARKVREHSHELESRTPFERDRDRVLYSAYFRRLSAVTQVSSPTELHTFHNRLTHTLEVAQIARRIAERAIRQSPSKGRTINADVCEAAALIHDLGHPPFGHNGEKTLDEISRKKWSACDGYEGNAQSFRIVTKLAVRDAGQEGLNLTSATLRASLKYPRLRKKDAGEYVEDDKFGVYQADKDYFDWSFGGELPGQKVLEAQIMDWADDVAYSTHDLYDFVLAGVIPVYQLYSADYAQLRDTLKENRKLKEVCDTSFLNVAISFDPLEFPVQPTSGFSSRQIANLRNWVSERIMQYTVRELRIVNNQLHIRQEVRDEVEILKALTYHYAIGSPALAVRQNGERTVLKGLFDVMCDDIKEGAKIIGEDARKRLENEGEPARVVLDFLSSMTDAQAISMYHKTHGVQLGSILDATTPYTL